MLPTETDDFKALLEELFAVHGKVANPAVLKAWWLALKEREFKATKQVIRKLIEESTELPTPARVIAMLRDEKPLERGSTRLLNPNKTTLLACRRHMEMYGRHQAAEAFGAEAVNILDRNPSLGYSAIDPQTYGGTLPEHIQNELKTGVRGRTNTQ